ncbi:hypothetical protein [Agarilytica rhodophyticola]|uniref:hypothetical protein n=1 Tax=Agarilytica rhodophyticola TaxID=1737490 RepID=UPI00131591B3|nr:hypothetical protein [Agarilytica rhodophyticola]
MRQYVQQKSELTCCLLTFLLVYLGKIYLAEEIRLSNALKAFVTKAHINYLNVKAFDYESKGRGFDSSRARHFFLSFSMVYARSGFMAKV